MELTKKQEEGLKIAVARHRAHEKYTVIAGYAGTGKSTLVNTSTVSLLGLLITINLLCVRISNCSRESLSL